MTRAEREPTQAGELGRRGSPATLPDIAMVAGEEQADCALSGRDRWIGPRQGDPIRHVWLLGAYGAGMRWRTSLKERG